MATPWQTFPIEFKGGLISNLSPLQHGTNAVGSATILQNLEITKTGGYSKIKGYEKFDTSVVPGEDVILGVKVINASEALAVRSDGTQSVVYHSSGSGWTSLATATYKGGKVRFEELDFNQGRKIVFVDGINYPAVYDDTTNSVSYITSLPDVLGATFVAVFKNHTFYVKDTVLYYTAPQTYDNFDTGDAAGFLLMGETITGLSVFRDQLIVFCSNSIKRVTGSGFSDWNISPITDRMGCNNPDTIQEVGGDIMYVAPDGLRLLSATDRIGDFGLEIASDPISKDAETFLGSTTVFSSLVIREKAQYRIFAYSSSQRRSTARGLIATKVSAQGGSNIQWATTKGIKAYCSDSRYTSILNETILFANEDGYVYELDTGSNFDGDLIEAIYESPYMPINDPQIRKTFYKMTLYASPSGSMDLDINLRYDFADTARVGKIQPKTFKVGSTGFSVFIFGETGSVFYKLAMWKDADGYTAPTVGQTHFLIEKVKYDVGTDAARIVVYKNGVVQTGYTVSTSATTETIKAAVVSNFNGVQVIETPAVTATAYDTTVVLSSGVLETDTIEIYVLPVDGVVSSASTYGGELDKVYDKNVIGSGKTVAIRIEDNSSNPSFTLDTILLEFRQNDRQ